MNHADHVHLIEAGIERNSGGVWADFGAGSGAFTLALRDLAGPDVDLIAVDRDRAGLQILRTTMERRFPGTRLRLLEGDMAGHLALPLLDGIMAANAIHYIPRREHVALLQRMKKYLRPEGRLIAVEYDAETGNRWVPYPMSYSAFQELALAAGFMKPRAARNETITLASPALCRLDVLDHDELSRTDFGPGMMTARSDPCSRSRVGVDDGRPSPQ